MNEFAQDTLSSVEGQSSSPIQWSSPANTDTRNQQYMYPTVLHVLNAIN